MNRFHTIHLLLVSVAFEDRVKAILDSEKHDLILILIITYTSIDVKTTAPAAAAAANAATTLD